MILRLLNSLQADLESFTIGDPQGVILFVAKAKTFRDIRRELAKNSFRNESELGLINNKMASMEEHLIRLEEAKAEFQARLEDARKFVPAVEREAERAENALATNDAIKSGPSFPVEARSRPGQFDEPQVRRRQLAPLTKSNELKEPKAGNKQDQRAVIEEVSADLVHLARRLKHNNLAIQELVERDKSVVDEASSNLTLNAGRFQTQHRELQRFSSKSWATTWRLIVLTFLILGSIWLAFMLIIITRKNQ